MYLIKPQRAKDELYFPDDFKRLLSKLKNGEIVSYKEKDVTQYVCATVYNKDGEK